MDWLLFLLILVGLVALTVIASMIVSAVEAVHIAKYTGVDPRAAKRKASSSAPTIT